MPFASGPKLDTLCPPAASVWPKVGIATLCQFSVYQQTNRSKAEDNDARFAVVMRALPCSWGAGSVWEEAGASPLTMLFLRWSSVDSHHLCPGGGGSRGCPCWASLPGTLCCFPSAGTKPIPVKLAPVHRTSLFLPYSAIPCTQLLGHVGEE